MAMADKARGEKMIVGQINGYIDHTLLKPDATRPEIINLCDEAQTHHFAAVCVNPIWVSLCSNFLARSTVTVCTVVGFPLGANSKKTKAFEAMEAIDLGAKEIDMVINISALKSHSIDGLRLMEEDIRAVREVLPKPITLKVIFETCLLTQWEKEMACRVSVKAGADFVKTSTGFSKSGATIEDVALMRKMVGNDIGVKASGGIRDYQTALAMITAGATRIGTSSGVKILQESLG